MVKRKAPILIMPATPTPHGLDTGNETTDDDARAAATGKMPLSGRQKSMMVGKRPNLDKALLVNATGPIGNRVSDSGSKNCRDESRPERHLAKPDETANSDKDHGARRKQSNDRQGFAGRHEKGRRNCQIRMESDKFSKS